MKNELALKNLSINLTWACNLARKLAAYLSPGSLTGTSQAKN